MANQRLRFYYNEKIFYFFIKHACYLSAKEREQYGDIEIYKGFYKNVSGGPQIGQVTNNAIDTRLSLGENHRNAYIAFANGTFLALGSDLCGIMKAVEDQKKRAQDVVTIANTICTLAQTVQNAKVH